MLQEAEHRTRLRESSSGVFASGVRTTGGGGPGTLEHFCDLLSQLVTRDLKLMYKRSALGITWTFITPLLQLVTFSFLFYAVLGVKQPNYASWAFTGLLAWNWFQMSLLAASRSITENGVFLMQPRFPSVILPLSAAVTWLIHLLVAVPAILLLYWINGITIAPTAALLPGLLLLQFAITITLAYPLAALSVTFRDTHHILNIVLSLAIHLTPVFYSISIVPQQFVGFYKLNPMSHLIEAYRAILIDGCFPDWRGLFVIAVMSVIVFPVGFLFFRRQSSKFAEEM